jgi:guanidinopropionase
MSDDLLQRDVATVPRFTQIATFMRAVYREQPDGLDIAMVGVPFDSGSSFRSGARHGPAQLREMSRLIRRVNYATQVAPFDTCRVGDIGDAPVNPLSIEESLASIREFFETIAASGALPLAAGGDHTITLPILRALVTDGPVALVQVDAHSDTLDIMLGERYANGTPFRRAIEEDLLDPRYVVQIGIRGTLFDADEHAWAREVGITIIDINEFYELGVRGVIRKVLDLLGDRPAYLTFDIDALDPSCAPGTGSPEPGGLGIRDAQNLLRGMAGLQLIGADVTELSPPLDPSGSTAIVTANLMFEELCLLAQTVQRRRQASGRASGR